MANPFSFPTGFHLLISTHECVFSWSHESLEPVFRSATNGGILAARQSGDGRGTLAIADSQVVILQNVNTGTNREYKLEGEEGDVRLLQYSSDSSILFFTCTVSTAVQAYSITGSRPIEPAHTHPSPPSVVATSKGSDLRGSDLLLVASDSPPTISIQDLHVRSASVRNKPLFFKPPASEHRVVCASFHPLRSTTFILGFSDGTLAVYRMPKMVETKPVREPAEIGRFRKLHKAHMGGIVAAEFLPGFYARTVSIGRDGKCRLVDFDGKLTVLRTWQISGPATCLSVLPARKLFTAGLPRTSVSSTGVDSGAKVLIAIGREDGKVLVFNSLGLLEIEMNIGSGVFGVQWVERETTP